MPEGALPRAIDGPIFRSEASHDVAPLLTDVLSGTAAHADGEGAAIIQAAQPEHMRCGHFFPTSRHDHPSDGGADAPDVAGDVLLGFRLYTAPIAHSAPHCRLRILKGARESFECSCVLAFMRTRPLVHVSSILGPVSARPKSWYDRGFIRFIILTLSARHSPGILALLSDSGGNECPSWRWHCRCEHP